MAFALAKEQTKFIERMIRSGRIEGKGTTFTAIILCGYIAGALAKLVLAGSGYAFPAPLMLSRSQTVTVPVVTYLDMAAIGAAVLVLAVGLVLLGRPWIARRARARIAGDRRIATQAESS